MAMFKQVADVQTADMLNLPVPKANYQIVKVAATETQKKMVESFAERAEKIHNKMHRTRRLPSFALMMNGSRKRKSSRRELLRCMS